MLAFAASHDGRYRLTQVSNRPFPNRTGTFPCIRLSRHRIYFVSRPDPVSQVRQPEAVVFSSVDLTVALPTDGHLLPVLESRHFRSASSLSRAELLIRVTPFLLKPCVLPPFGLRLLRGLCRPGHYCL